MRRNWKIYGLMGMTGMVIFGGAAAIFFLWLNPWLNHVQALRDEKVIVPGVEATDSDGDGLSLAEESGLGTNDNLTDTDGDELQDNEEIIWGTDPLDSDTDGDGYADGLEVETGHDPLNK